MRDDIEEKNMREKISRSIIKRQFIHYMTEEEIIQKKRAEEERLEWEKQKKLEEDMKRRKKELESGYNPATNSYSGNYGKNKDVDELTKSQIDKILGERNAAFMQALQDEKNSVGDE